MSDKITELTPEQEAQIPIYLAKWLKAVTDQTTIAQAQDIAVRMYKRMDQGQPLVLLAPSPYAAVQWSAMLNNTEAISKMFQSHGKRCDKICPTAIAMPTGGDKAAALAVLRGLVPADSVNPKKLFTGGAFHALCLKASFVDTDMRQTPEYEEALCEALQIESQTMHLDSTRASMLSQLRDQLKIPTIAATFKDLAEKVIAQVEIEQPTIDGLLDAGSQFSKRILPLLVNVQTDRDLRDTLVEIVLPALQYELCNVSNVSDSDITTILNESPTMKFADDLLGIWQDVASGDGNIKDLRDLRDLYTAVEVIQMALRAQVTRDLVTEDKMKTLLLEDIRTAKSGSEIKFFEETELKSKMKDVLSYCGYWWIPHATTYDFAMNVVGVKDPDNLLPAFVDYCKYMAFSVPTTTVCVIAQNPHTIHWDDLKRLHCEEGPAVAWMGYGIWAIQGTRLTEQIVMRPETLTLNDMDNTADVEVRRLMIERFGVKRYLGDSGARVIHQDKETCRKGAAPRCLIEDKKGEKWLIGTDGSTSRTYFMAVPNDVTSCAEAHTAICGFDENKILNKS